MERNPQTDGRNQNQTADGEVTEEKVVMVQALLGNEGEIRTCTPDTYFKSRAHWSGAGIVNRSTRETGLYISITLFQSA
jgi:hypothetical protein